MKKFLWGLGILIIAVVIIYSKNWLSSCSNGENAYKRYVSQRHTITYNFKIRGYENTDRLVKFIDNVKAGNIDRINVVGYSTEGDPIIYQLYFNGEDIIVALDSSKSKYGGNDNNKIHYSTYSKENLMNYLSGLGF